MAFIKTNPNEWQDFFTPKDNLSPTILVSPAIHQDQNKNITPNNTITQSSKVILPKGFALIAIQNEQITSLVAEPGYYEYIIDSHNAPTFIPGNNILSTTINDSWNKYRYGGNLSPKQQIFYINLKEISNNKFGTKDIISWQDSSNNLINATTRGTYSFKIIDPIIFIKNFTPSKYLINYKDFDLNDITNPLFNILISSLPNTFSKYFSNPSIQNKTASNEETETIFTNYLEETIEETFSWTKNYGIKLTKSNIIFLSNPENIPTNTLNTCPKCCSNSISLNTSTSKLECDYCHYEFNHEKIDNTINNTQVNETVEDNNVVTLKCPKCSKEIVTLKAFIKDAKCHWCKNYLSENDIIPNGNTPSIILPFNVTKENAQTEINNYLQKRKPLINTNITKDLSPSTIKGFYAPYLMININSEVHLIGIGEHLNKSYTRGSNNREYYDADLYNIERTFNLSIENLTTNNEIDTIITSLMPYDIENSTHYNSNYLNGYTSEKRTINEEKIKSHITSEVQDIAKISINETLNNYDRGVIWNNEEINITNENWQIVYLPIWLYTYVETKDNKTTFNYVALNARTKKITSNIPLYYPNLIVICVFIELISLLIMFMIDFIFERVLIFAGPLVFLYIYLKNKTKKEENKEYKYKIDNLRNIDNFVETKKRLSNPKIEAEKEEKKENNIKFFL